MTVVLDPDMVVLVAEGIVLTVDELTLVDVSPDAIVVVVESVVVGVVVVYTSRSLTGGTLVQAVVVVVLAFEAL